MNTPRELLTSKLSSKQQAVLRKMKISDTEPGPLLTNIACLINAIGTGVPTSSAYFALPQRLLAELNLSLIDPMPHDLKRPQLRSFPDLMGLFLLLRSTGLAVGETKPKRAVLIDPAMLEQWRSLNPTERYFTLMTSWLYETSWDCVGQRGGRRKGMLRDVRDTYLQLDHRSTTLTDHRWGILYGIESHVAVSLLHQFGWVRLTYAEKPKPGKAAEVREIKRTDFGDAMFVATCQLTSYREDELGDMQAKLENYFPDWNKSLVGHETEYRDGQYTFKVSVGRAWRRIVAPASASMEQLAWSILDAYQFDHSHLYQFELRGTKGSLVTVASPYLEEADYFAEEMRVGDVPLLVGATMVFHYDFGDDWRFQVALESVDEANRAKIKAPKVTAESGKSPEQYDHGDW
ncbi:MAG: hypothetical protein R3C09_05450 [Pirellulaceae bacterium]|jgi:hypothetical protein